MSDIDELPVVSGLVEYQANLAIPKQVWWISKSLRLEASKPEFDALKPAIPIAGFRTRLTGYDVRKEKLGRK